MRLNGEKPIQVVSGAKHKRDWLPRLCCCYAFCYAFWIVIIALMTQVRHRRV